jgi:hypothetical protein
MPQQQNIPKVTVVGRYILKTDRNLSIVWPLEWFIMGGDFSPKAIVITQRKTKPVQITDASLKMICVAINSVMFRVRDWMYCQLRYRSISSINYANYATLMNM